MEYTENTRKVFTQGRMPPWELEHGMYIEKELQKLAIDNPGEAAALKELYAKKMEDYMAEHPEYVSPFEPVVPSEPVKDDMVEDIMPNLIPEEVIEPKKKSKKLIA